MTTQFKPGDAVWLFEWQLESWIKTSVVAVDGDMIETSSLHVIHKDGIRNRDPALHGKDRPDE